jgi:hypothetical protein
MHVQAALTFCSEEKRDTFSAIGQSPKTSLAVKLVFSRPLLGSGEKLRGTAKLGLAVELVYDEVPI